MGFALSWAAPAQPIKMGMRLFWTGTMLKSIKTCANIYDLQPGLVPPAKRHDTNFKFEAWVLCYKGCRISEEWVPLQASGLKAMWTSALMRSFVDHPQGCPIPSAISVEYTDMMHEDPEACQRFSDIQSQDINKPDPRRV